MRLLVAEERRPLRRLAPKPLQVPIGIDGPAESAGKLGDELVDANELEPAGADDQHVNIVTRLQPGLTESLDR
jgi:hypothetical protein